MGFDKLSLSGGLQITPHPLSLSLSKATHQLHPNRRRPASR
jgi:hypothetical protein